MMYTVADAMYRNMTSPERFERRQMFSSVNGRRSSAEEGNRASSACETRRTDHAEEHRGAVKRSLSGGARESRMAELDDIQRSMEHEEPQFQRYKPREDHGKEMESVPASFNNTGRSRTPTRLRSSSPTSEASFMEPAGTGERIINHEWTFEEQFKQLYELGHEPGRKDFLDDLFTFMQKRGTPVNRVPIMAKQTLDLFKLFQLVVDKGGLVEVINKKIWREIIKGLNLPASVTSAAFTLRTQYMKYLYPYECAKRKLSSPAELQAAIDGNRRDGRRTFGSLSSQGSDGTHGFGSPSPPLSASSFSANHSPTMVPVHRTSPGPPTTPTDEVLVPPSVHGNNGVAVLHSPGVIHRLNAEFSPKHSSSVPDITSRGGSAVAQSAATREQSPSASPTKRLALSNDYEAGNERPKSFTKIKIETPSKATFSSLSVSSTCQSADSLPTRGREQRPLPLTHVDHVNDNSLFVSVELNGVEYQGVLFARRRGRLGSSHE